MATNPFDRVLGAVLGPPVQWVGQRIERELQQVAPDLPEPPVWMGLAVAVLGPVGAVAVQLLADRRGGRVEADPDPERSRSERAEPKAERGTTSDGDGRDELGEALETLDVSFPPVPEHAIVKEAYRARVKETHPDRGGKATEFIEVREAWERVTDRQELSDGALEDGGN